MKITKFGHCCLLIEENNTKILTDPGEWSDLPSDLASINAIFITHEHADHIHIESLRKIIAANPELQVFTNSAVGKLLTNEGIEFTLCKDNETATVVDIVVKAFETKHAAVYPIIEPVLNTAFLFNEKFYYPGDALFIPEELIGNIEILALPVAGPWLKISEAVDYALKVKPRFAFPVHDGMLRYFGAFHGLPGKVLPEAGIKFVPLEKGELNLS